MSIDKPKSAYVELKAHLFEAGIPLVSLYARKISTGYQHFIACAIPDDLGEVDYYLAVYVDRKNLLKYFNDQCDLRYLFEYASGGRYYKAGSLTPNNKGKVQMVEYFGDVTEEMLPDPRFFASAHTSDYGASEVVGVEQRLLIDGNWDMQEFGTFYQRFSDLYSFEQAVRYVSEDTGARSDRVRAAFASKPFKGGSSYMGLFSDLFDVIPVNERPVLEGIEYHSPGYVDLRGKSDILDHIKDQLSGFLDRLEDIQKAHDDLRTFMSEARLLKITADNVELSDDQAEDLKKLTDIFFDAMPFGENQVLYSLAQENSVVYAKIGLGLFRRLRTTAHFFAQGRLSYDG